MLAGCPDHSPDIFPAEMARPCSASIGAPAGLPNAPVGRGQPQIPPGIVRGVGGRGGGGEARGGGRGVGGW